MFKFVTSYDCRRKVLLSHFDEKLKTHEMKNCNNCDNCSKQKKYIKKDFNNYSFILFISLS